MTVEDFRLITLTSFLLKGLERLVSRFVKADPLML